MPKRSVHVPKNRRNPLVFEEGASPTEFNEIESKESRKERQKLFDEMWMWMQRNVKRLMKLKGWSTLERRDGEFIALIHSELSECLEFLRQGNPKSDHVAEISGAEEELADVIIRIMDFAEMKGWNIPRAIHLKMKFNKTRPYRHGNKLL